MIKEWINEYQPKSTRDAQQALREIMQEIALLGLERAGFFEKAAFYGGTALRIFHGLDRFSEDLDFSLLETEPEFSLQPFLETMRKEFLALGIEVSVSRKEKAKASNVDSAFLKSDTAWQEITLESVIPTERLNAIPPSLKIKIEVDKKPPPGFTTENKILLRPVSFYTRCFTLPDLFAGKMHALLFRKWGTRVKGRDWYDMEWYIRKGTPINLGHLTLRAIDSGDWQALSMSKEEFMQLLVKKIESVNIEKVKEDVVPFITDTRKLDIWSARYFMDLVQKIRYMEE